MTENTAAPKRIQYMMPDDVPLICDPPPVSRVITTNQPISLNDATTLRRAWELGMRGQGVGAIIIGGIEFEINEIPPGRLEWPDAEFCAA